MKKQTILITGGTGKLGKCFAAHFSRNGYKVIITSTSEEKANAFIESSPNNRNIDYFITDLREPEASKSLIEDIGSRDIKINHLINNARSLSSLVVGENNFSSRNNLINEYLMHVVVPYELSINIYLNQKKSIKNIINIGSQYGAVAINPSLYENDLSKAPIQYGLAKSSLNHLTKELAVRFAKDGIRVNCIAFGGIDGRVDKNFKDRYSKLTPMGRMLREEDILGPVDFLLSETSSSITGEVLAADGGWTIW